MTVVIFMRGALEPVEIEDSFVETLNSLNNAAAGGKQFVGTKTSDGDNVLLNVEEVLHATEKEETIFG
jgi:hypothetical protein